MDFELTIFSWLFVLIMGLLVCIPYLRKKRDLFTGFNLFLGGSALFVGFSGLNSVSTGHYFNYPDWVYYKFFFCTIMFYVTLVVSYHKLDFPVRIAKKAALGFRPIGMNKTVFLLFVALSLMLGQVIAINIPGVGRFLYQVGLVSPGFAVVFAFFAWGRAKQNPLLLIALLGTVLLVFAALFTLGGGRRAFYGALFALPLCLYWRSMRFWAPSKVILLCVICMIPAVVFDVAYNSVRWAGTSRSSSFDVGGAERLEMLLNSMRGVSQKELTRSAQTGVEYSLTTIYLYSESDVTFKVKPLHSLYVLLTFPIPRTFWEGKPSHLGLTLPFDAGVIERGTKTNAGPGIAGHSYHDGGVLAAIIYAILLGGALKYIDTLLRLRSNDILLLGFVAASAFHIIGWSRGDIASFTVWPIICYVVMLGFRILANFGQRGPSHGSNTR